MNLRIHAICLALNEEVLIHNQLTTLYPFCTGISVLTQYDRDWYGKRVTADRTLEIVANYPDPEGKIHLVLRKWRDQAAALNCEMAAVASRPDRRIISHGTALEEIRRFHAKPDYFWIVDADEFYDPDTIPEIVSFLARKRPRGMRVHGYNYLRTWNRRVPMEVVRFCQFGFLRPGVTFVSVRHTSFNESRLSKMLGILHLPDFSAGLFGFVECPKEIGVFHHGCWLGDRERLRAKASKSAHTWVNTPEYPDSVASYRYQLIPTKELPRNIRDAKWPADYFEDGLTAEIS